MLDYSTKAREKQVSILIVDDMKANLELLEVIFKSEGFNVLTVQDSSYAMDILKEGEVDIAVLDVMMPGMDGFELCRHIKANAGTRFFPVILLTALNDKQSKLTALESGADDFISKPFDKVELIAKIKSLLKLKSLQEELDHSENIILTLAVALESRDPYTKGHSVRVAKLSKLFGEYLTLEKKDQEYLRKAGYLHDIGKIGMSESVLCKGDSLTKEEIEMVKQHVEVGEDICRPLESMKPVLSAIRHHHERWDGNGFPDGLKDEEIPLMARILAIVDSLDAMVSSRPYREKRTVQDGIEIMRREQYSGQWDPFLIGYFIDMIQVRGEEFYRNG